MHVSVHKYPRGDRVHVTIVVRKHTILVECQFTDQPLIPSNGNPRRQVAKEKKELFSLCHN